MQSDTTTTTNTHHHPPPFPSSSNLSMAWTTCQTCHLGLGNFFFFFFFVFKFFYSFFCFFPPAGPVGCHHICLPKWHVKTCCLGPRYILFFNSYILTIQKMCTNVHTHIFFFLSFLRMNTHMCVCSQSLKGAHASFGDIHFFFFITRHPKRVLNPHHVCFNFFN